MEGRGVEGGGIEKNISLERRYDVRRGWVIYL